MLQIPPWFNLNSDGSVTDAWTLYLSQCVTLRTVKMVDIPRWMRACRCWFSTERDLSFSLKMFTDSSVFSAFCFGAFIVSRGVFWTNGQAGEFSKTARLRSHHTHFKGPYRSFSLFTTNHVHSALLPAVFQTPTQRFISSDLLGGCDDHLSERGVPQGSTLGHFNS